MERSLFLARPQRHLNDIQASSWLSLFFTVSLLNEAENPGGSPSSLQYLACTRLRIPALLPQSTSTDKMVSIAQFIVGIVGNITSICLFLSPASTFARISKVKSTEEFSAVPYIATLLNCLLWLFYGSPFVKMGVLVITINAAGAFIEIIYLCIYLVYAKDRRQLRNALLMLAGAIVFFLLVVLVNMLAFHQHLRREVVGILCVIVGTSMYISPLTVMKTVLRTKSTEFMPLPLSVFNLLNGIIWTAYALIGRDLFITIPNALGVFFGICQLALYTYAWHCGKSNPKAVVDLEENSSNEGPTSVVSMSRPTAENHTLK